MHNHQEESKKQGRRNRQGSVEAAEHKHTDEAVLQKECTWDIVGTTTTADSHHCDLALTWDPAVAASVSCECIMICSVFASCVQG